MALADMANANAANRFFIASSLFLKEYRWREAPNGKAARRRQWEAPTQTDRTAQGHAEIIRRF